MSLKGFHVLFITVATMLCAGFTLWAVSQLGQGGAAPALAIAGLVSSVALPVYGAWFLRKTKGVDFL
jgi:Na+/melibiose symporter-like transporter